MYGGLAVMVGLFVYGIIEAIRLQNLMFVGFAVVYIIIITLIFTSEQKRSLFGSFVDITDEGVTFISRKKALRIMWDHIKYVGITESGNLRYVVFSKNSGFTSDVLDHNNLTSREYIIVKNRKGLIEVIRRYWEGEIEGE
jgi:hypothetical protein